MDKAQQNYLNELTYSKEYWEGFKAGYAVRLNRTTKAPPPFVPAKVRYYDRDIEESIKALLAGRVGDDVKRGLETKDIAQRIGFVLSSGKSSESHRILCHHIKMAGFVRKQKKVAGRSIWLWSMPENKQ